MNKMSGLALGGVVAAILMVLHYAEAKRIYVVGEFHKMLPHTKIGLLTRISQLEILYTGSHNLIEVSEESYNSCSSANPIGTTCNTGPANVTLNRGDQHYYICGIDNHCNNGQRLAINVSVSSTALPPSATPAPPPPSSSVPSSFPTTFLPFFLLFIFVLIAF